MRFSRMLLVCLLVLSLAPMLPMGCASKDKCSDDSDCPQGQNCRLDQVTGGKKCLTGFLVRPCVPTCKSGQQCINARCVTFCDPACGPNQACKDGTCVDVGQSCEPACSNNQRCVAGKCTSKSERAVEPNPTERTTTENTTTPEEYGKEKPVPIDTTRCNSNNDCQSGFKCEQGTCIPPSGGTEVPKEGPAPEDAGSSLDRAVTEAPPQDQATTDQAGGCSKDTDCPAGQTCQAGTCFAKGACTGCKDNEQCVSGKCIAEQDPNIGADCTQSKTCSGGLSCFALTPQKSRCFQTCKTHADCSKNALRKSCFRLSASQNYCVQYGTVGQKCDLFSKVQVICDSNSICHENVCRKPVVVKPQDSCGSQGRVCSKDYLCLRFPAPAGKTNSYCMERCTVGGASNCKGGGTCEKLNGTFGYCLPAGKAQADEICGGQTGGKTFDSSKTCKPGLSCVNLPYHSICLQFADKDCATSKLSCPSGRKCQLINGPNGQKFSICSKVCTTTSDCGKAHMVCNPNGKTCWPKSP